MKTAAQLKDTKIFVYMATPMWKKGKLLITRLKGGNFTFERVSPADVWDMIATIARERLFRVPRRATQGRKPNYFTEGK